jgi:hypothetical protein
VCEAAKVLTRTVEPLMMMMMMMIGQYNDCCFEVSNEGIILNNKSVALEVIYNSNLGQYLVTSSVSIVSGYGLDDRAMEIRSPAEAKGFFL